MSQIVVQPDPRVAEQFEDLAQQHHASTLGVWVFLATEVLFFGSLFAGFYIMRARFTADFADAARELKWWLGGLNTAVLLISSYCMAMAVHAAHASDSRRVTRRLLYTAGLGVAFLAIKSFEYFLEYRESLIPVLHLSPHGNHFELFMVIYFISTLLHALHVTIGICVILVLVRMSRSDDRVSRRFNFIEGTGLYWHFVDLVWVFLYPTLYLLRHA